MKIHHCDENTSLWWKFIKCWKINIVMKIHHCDENSFWWRFIIVIKKSSLWWKFIIVMKIHHYDENSSLWWKLIIVMKIHHCDEKFIKCYHGIRQRDNVHNCDWANSSLWWKFISVMKIHKFNYIHQWDTNSLV